MIPLYMYIVLCKCTNLAIWYLCKGDRLVSVPPGCETVGYAARRLSVLAYASSCAGLGDDLHASKCPPFSAPMNYSRNLSLILNFKKCTTSEKSFRILHPCNRRMPGDRFWLLNTAPPLLPVTFLPWKAVFLEGWVCRESGRFPVYWYIRYTKVIIVEELESTER